MTRTALEVVTLYNLEIWNKGRLDLVPELCADPMIRYDANSVTSVGIDEQIARIRHNFEELRPTFDPVVLAGGDEFVTLVWNVTGRDPDWKWCGIEVFRVVGGKIVEVWNGPYVDGRWVRTGALEIGFSGAERRAVPVNSASIADGRGQLVVPLDDSAIDDWLGAALGAPTIGGDEARFSFGGVPQPLDIAYAEGGGPPVFLSGAIVENLEIRWARSGLTNVTIELEGMAVASARPMVPEPAPARRLAECTGALGDDKSPLAKVVGASIRLDPRRQEASGEVTLRMPADRDPATLAGERPLAFGWRSGGAAVGFDVPRARISPPEKAFPDGGEIEAVCRWEAKDVSAVRRR